MIVLNLLPKNLYMKFFRDASVCSLSCSNGISEGGKTFVRTCLNGEWVGDLDDMECDGKICHTFVTICHSDVTLFSPSDTCHFIDTFTDNIQRYISVYYNSSWKTEVFCTQLQITFMFACKRLYLVSKMDCYKCTLFSVSKVSIRISNISAQNPEF